MKMYTGMEKTELRDLSADFKAVRASVVELLKKTGVSAVMISETVLVFETLCSKIFEQRETADAPVTVSGTNRFGSTMLKISFEGGMYKSEPDDPRNPSFEDQILAAYAEMIDYSYQSGYNKIVITAKRSYSKSLALYVISTVLALVIYTLIHSLTSASFESQLRNNVIYPLETMFSNAALMVGAPVTFLSLFKNLTDTFVRSERNSDIRRLSNVCVVSSLISILFAVAAAFMTKGIVKAAGMSLGNYVGLNISMPLSEFISSLIPSDIFTPLETVSPFPLIILVMLTTYALCSTGKYFDRIKGSIDVLYALFTRMLGIVIFTLPFFLFTAILDKLLIEGAAGVTSMIMLMMFVIAASVLIILFYASRLLIKKVPIGSFTKKLLPLLAENIKIASSIDAVPYNTRYCAMNYGLDRRKLESTLPVLAEINLDGNCFIITMTALAVTLSSSTTISAVDVIFIGVLVFFLSLGAPAQPGSCLIGMSIIMSTAGALEFIPLAICCEVFLGWLVNVINVTGDIVTVMIYKNKGTEKSGSR